MNRGAGELARLLLEPTSTRRSLVTGAVVGALVMLVLFGLPFVLGTSPYWEYPRGDTKLYVMGFREFVHEPWGWPPAIVRSVAPPEGLSLTFTDSIPVLALPAKLVEPLVPSALRATFESPYGLWLLLVFTLQGVMAARIDRRIGLGSIASAALTAAFASTVPAFLVRFGHDALDSHFFLLWALLLVIVARTSAPERRQAVEWLALLFLVTLTHPYLLAMSGALFGAWCVTALIHHRERRRLVLVTALGAVTGVVMAMGALGLLRSQTVSGHAVGFGEASFNPASLVVSQFSELGRLLGFDARVADATGYQYEGQDYLGYGLVLVVGAALFTRARAFGAALRRHRVLAALFVGLVVFALSNRIFVGRTLVVAYSWPGFLSPFSTQFRSSGRFIWIPTYALVLWSIAQLARRGRRGAALLALALLAQWPDLAPFRSWARENTAAPEERFLDWHVWGELIDRHEAIVTYPHYECLSLLPLPDDFSLRSELYETSFMAASRHRVVSSLFTPRTNRDCSKEQLDREAIVPRDGTLYVLFRRVATGRAIAALERGGARCARFDGGYACSTRIREDDERHLATHADVTPEAWVSFRDGTDSIAYQGPGWGVPDAVGRWAGNPAEGRRTSLHYVLGERPASAYVFELELDGGRLHGETVSVAMNDRDVGTLEVDPHVEQQRRRVCVPPDLPNLGRWLIVDLVPREPAEPVLTEMRVRAARVALANAGECPTNRQESPDER